MTNDLKSGLKYIHNHKTFVPKIRAIQVNFDVNCSYDMKHVISCGNHERSMSFSRASSRNHHVLMLFPVNRRVDFSRTRSDYIIGLGYIIGVYDDNLTRLPMHAFFSLYIDETCIQHELCIRKTELFPSKFFTKSDSLE